MYVATRAKSVWMEQQQPPCSRPITIIIILVYSAMVIGLTLRAASISSGK